MCMCESRPKVFFFFSENRFNLQRVGDGFTASLLTVRRTLVKNNSAENYTWRKTTFTYVAEDAQRYWLDIGCDRRIPFEED